MSNAMPAQYDASDRSSVLAVIPRINIGIFCDDEQTFEVMQLVAADRRLARAHVAVNSGGIMAAYEAGAAGVTPNLLIVESRSHGENLLLELNQLAEVCDASTKVVVIGHVNDVILYRELMRQGVAEYLVAPVSQMQIIESVAGMYRDPKARPVGRIVAFVGAKGGVGSSTIAHNVGWTMANKFAADTIITDLDLAFGTAGLNFNQEAGAGIADALSSHERMDPTLLDRMLTRCGDKLSLLACSGIVDRDIHIDVPAVDAILDVVRQSVPYIVIDVPNIWAPWTKHTLIHADEILITATPELACLRNARNMVEHLKSARPNDKSPRLILNQVGIAKRPEIPAVEFAKAIGIGPCAIIPFDAQVFGTASSNGQMIGEMAPRSKAAEAFATIAETLAGREPPPQQIKRSLFSFSGKLALRKK
jgi:pilus assembly protein CpaE